MLFPSSLTSLICQNDSSFHTMSMTTKSPDDKNDKNMHIAFSRRGRCLCFASPSLSNGPCAVWPHTRPGRPGGAYRALRIVCPAWPHRDGAASKRRGAPVQKPGNTRCGAGAGQRTEREDEEGTVSPRTICRPPSSAFSNLCAKLIRLLNSLIPRFRAFWLPPIALFGTSVFVFAARKKRDAH